VKTDLYVVPAAARDCDSWGCCNSSQQDFINTEKHQVFHGGAACYDIWHFSPYDPTVRLAHIAIISVTCYGMKNWCGTAISKVISNISSPYLLIHW